MITRLAVRGFRSFRETEISFEPVTVLLGPNGAGKTNIAFALMTLSNLLHRPLNSEEGEEDFGGAGFERLTFRLEPDRAWEFQLEAREGDTSARYEVRVGRRGRKLQILGEALTCESPLGKVEIDGRDGTTRVVDGTNVFWPVVQGTLPVILREKDPAHPTVAAALWVASQLPWVARFAPDASALRSSKLANRASVQPSGRGFVAELRRLKDRAGSRFPAIVAKLREAMAFVSEIGFEVDGNDVQLEATVRGIASPLPATSLSDGFLLALFLAWATEVHDRGVLFLEDPDRSVHPYLHGRIVDWVDAAVRGGRGPQVVLSTHSPSFVNTACGGRLERLRIVERSDELGTTVHPLVPPSTEELKSALEMYRDAPGTLWYSGSVGGVPQDLADHDGEAEDRPPR